MDINSIKKGAKVHYYTQQRAQIRINKAQKKLKSPPINLNIEKQPTRNLATNSLINLIHKIK